MSEATSETVDISRLSERGMITVRGDLTLVDLQYQLTSLAGVDMPSEREAKVEDGRGLVWMSPDEVLMVLPKSDVEGVLGTFRETLGAIHHLAVDVSDARAVFELKGLKWREVIAKGAPVDLSPEAFALGQMRRTRLGQVAVAFWMTEPDTAELVCFASLAEFVSNWLKMAAKAGSFPDYLKEYKNDA